MKFEIRTVYGTLLDEYKDVLDDYNAEYFRGLYDGEEDDENSLYNHFALIKLENLPDVLSLQKKLGVELIFVGDVHHCIGSGKKFTDFEQIVIKDTFVD